MVTTGAVVAIVPARGGSKSIPRKNIRPLGGVPLIAYSIAAGHAARLVDRVIVSTDDEAIAEIARQYGAEVPFLRPASLAQDATPDLPVFQHALDCLERQEGRPPELIVQLRPTSPVRPLDCVDSAIERLRAHHDADSVRGVVLAGQSPYKMWQLGGDGAMTPLLRHGGPEAFNRPRQELPTTYWQTGHIDVVRSAVIRGHESMSGARILPLVIDGAYACDIDTELDWQRAEWLLQHLDRPFVSPRRRARSLPAVIRLVVFDFDGVLTDNRVWVSEHGEESVACSRADGLGIEMLGPLGVEGFVLSTERNPVVGRRCAKLRLSYEQGVAHKASRLRALMAERRLDPASVIYVGNDVNDLECMRIVGCSVAVADALPPVRDQADILLTRAGGHGAVRELCDRLAAHLRSARC